MKLKNMVVRGGRFVASELGMPLSASDRLLKSASGRHAGKRAFILGMGPSLRVADLEKLRDEITFGCNKIYLCFGETDWRPTYYTVSDVLVAENNREEIVNGMDARGYFFSREVAGILQWPNEAAATYETRRSFNKVPAGQEHFQDNLVRGIYGGGATVVFDMIQFAYAMGIQEVYLLGIDFSFAFSEEAVTDEDSKSGKVLVSEGEVNHFHRNYRKPGERWTVPRMEPQRDAFAYARKAFEADGRVLLNASRETKLDVLERVDLDSLLSSPE